jgi:hypothetical protein
MIIDRLKALFLQKGTAMEVNPSIAKFYATNVIPHHIFNIVDKAFFLQK